MADETIQDYVVRHTIRGECQCGACIDKGTAADPKGHTADMVFFKVAATDSPTTEDFVRLTKSTRGEFADVDPFDGKEHGYIELGGWIGDQGLAMQYMGLGVLLGVFKLLSPDTLLGDSCPPDLRMQMVGAGMLSVMMQPEHAHV